MGKPTEFLWEPLKAPGILPVLKSPGSRNLRGSDSEGKGTTASAHVP